MAAAAAYAYAYAQQAEPISPPMRAAPAGTLRVHYVDVGQGDATVWEMPDGSLVLYDCGPPARDAQSNRLVRYLRDTLGRAPGSRIDALIASHGHLDHIGGCEEVFTTYEVAEVFEAWYEGADAPASYRRLLAEVEAEGARVRTLADLRVGAPLVPNTTLLWPQAFAPGGWDAIAESSLVVRLRHGSTTFCFQGDIEAGQEAALSGRCDVYLVGHHGSRYASSAAWLGRMQPQVAVASFGENAYGHPHPEALCRIQQAGASLYATPRVGGVVVSSDGVDIHVERGQAETSDFCAGASYWP